MKQTAVEWLWENLDVDIRLFTHCKDTFEQSKELEKQQMESCAIFFTKYAIDKIENKTNLKGEEQFEQYYNETFKK